MNTPSEDTPSQFSTPTETVPVLADLSDSQPTARNSEPSRFAVVDEAEPAPAAHELVVLPESENEFRESAEQAVREQLASLCRLGQRAVIESIGLGESLSRTKEQLGHGNWLPFLQAVGIKERTAQNYLLLAKYKEPLRAKYENNAGLTLTGALNAARRFNKAQAVEATLVPSIAEGIKSTAPAETVYPLPALGVTGASVDPEQIEARLVIARTIPPMKDYGDEDRAAFEEYFRLLAGTLYRAATEGIAERVVADDVLFVTVEAMHKFLVKRRKEAGA